MSASAISTMAATNPASSSSLYNKFLNLSFTQHSNQIPSHFPPKQKPFKFLDLKIHAPNFHPLSFSPASQFYCSSSTFDGFEISETEQEDLDGGFHEKQEIQDDDEEEEKVSESGEVGRLYIGNLPYAMSSSQLTEVFGEAGRVVSVEIIYDRVTDRSRGFGFVTMATLEEAKKAIQMFDGSLIGGRTVRVNFPEVPRGGEKEVMGPKIKRSYNKFVDSAYKIYAGNLGWGLTSESLSDAFADQPGFLSAKVIYDRDSGRSRGFGFVSFETAEDAESALNSMNGVDVEGRPLRLNMAAERAPTSPASSTSSLVSSELLTSISA